jgi:hypothetical protein
MAARRVSTRTDFLILHQFSMAEFSNNKINSNLKPQNEK